MLEIVGGFIDQGKQNLRMLQEYLARYKDISQYVYSHVFPEVYTTSKKRGFDLKSNFHILFKSYRDKQMIRQHSLAKNQSNYNNEQPKETNENEQKPIKNFDEFSDSEEQEVKQHAEKRLADRRKKAEELKAKRRKQKSEENKIKEGEMWNRLNELNGEFKKIRQLKKESKKIFATLLWINCSKFLVFFKCLIVNSCINRINVVVQKMSDTGFHLLPTNKLYKKNDTRQLKNFPAGYVGSFYRTMLIILLAPIFIPE